MDLISAISTVLIAILALIAGWFKCVFDQPVTTSRLFFIPHIGAFLSRISRLGWVIGVSVVALTILNLIAVSNAEKKLKAEREKINSIATSTLAQVKETNIGNTPIREFDFVFLTKRDNPTHYPTIPFSVSIYMTYTMQYGFVIGQSDENETAAEIIFESINNFYTFSYGTITSYYKVGRYEHVKGINGDHSVAYAVNVDNISNLNSHAKTYDPLTEKLVQEPWPFHKIGDFRSHFISITSDQPVDFDKVIMTINKKYYIELAKPTPNEFLRGKYTTYVEDFFDKIKILPEP